MDKIVAVLWKPEGQTLDEFNARLIAGGARNLLSAGAHKLRINIQDADVQAGAHLRQTNMAKPVDAIVQFETRLLAPEPNDSLLKMLTAFSARVAAWRVEETPVIRNTDYPAMIGGRTHGFSQIALLQVPPRLTPAEWLSIWQNDHTNVAIETQSNFEYIQNRVVRALTDDEPPIAAIVEECFPPEALTDPFVFFDAVGNKPKFDVNLKRMMDSCARFIDFDRIDVLITSQYNF